MTASPLARELERAEADVAQTQLWLDQAKRRRDELRARVYARLRKTVGPR
jgi:hypothetical protein